MGTEANKILFTSNQSNPSAGDWQNIQFTSTSEPAVFDNSGTYVSGSVIKYAILEYAGTNGATIITLNSVSPYIDHNLIQNVSGGGVYVDETSNDVVITNNEILGTPVAVNISGSATVADNTITNGSYSGIFVNGTGDAIILRNTISGYSVVNAPVLTGGGITVRVNGKAHIEDNIISGNSVVSGLGTANIGGGIVMAGQGSIVGNTVSSNYIKENLPPSLKN
jgi:parallel beta-helix repeat protein